MTLADYARWSLGACVGVSLLVVPFVYYRYEYSHSKRLREVVPGILYRSGQMTVPGFAEARSEEHTS